MARDGRSASVNQDVARPPSVETPADGPSRAVADPIAAWRDWTGRSLWAAQDVAGWWLQSQQQALRHTGLCVEVLAMAVRESAQAREVDDLLAVPVRVAGRYLLAASNLYGEGVQRLFDREWGWWRNADDGLQALAREAMRPVSSGAAPGDWAPLLGPWVRAFGDAGAVLRSGPADDTSPPAG